MMNYVDEQVPEDDMLLCVAMRLCAGLRNYLTPTDPDPETLMNRTELPDPHALHRRPDHLRRRVTFMQAAQQIGWLPVGPAPAVVPRQPGHDAAAPAGTALRGTGHIGAATKDLRAPRSPQSTRRRSAVQGELYQALGETYAELATTSARTLRLHGYDGPVRVVTDAPSRDLTDLECETQVVTGLPAGFASRFHKTQLY
nr:hypothetical protein [Micromonospora sp. DSM 115978]